MSLSKLLQREQDVMIDVEKLNFSDHETNEDDNSNDDNEDDNNGFSNSSQNGQDDSSDSPTFGQTMFKELAKTLISLAIHKKIVLDRNVSVPNSPRNPIPDSPTPNFLGSRFNRQVIDMLTSSNHLLDTQEKAQQEKHSEEVPDGLPDGLQEELQGLEKASNQKEQKTQKRNSHHTIRCYYWMKRQPCSKNPCPFAHEKLEKRTYLPRGYKTQNCENKFHEHCPYGLSCKYLHVGDWFKSGKRNPRNIFFFTRNESWPISYFHIITWERANPPSTCSPNYFRPPFILNTTFVFWKYLSCQLTQPSSHGNNFELSRLLFLALALGIRDPCLILCLFYDFRNNKSPLPWRIPTGFEGMKRYERGALAYLEQYHSHGNGGRYHKQCKLIQFILNLNRILHVSCSFEDFFAQCDKHVHIAKETPWMQRLRDTCENIPELHGFWKQQRVYHTVESFAFSIHKYITIYPNPLFMLPQTELYKQPQFDELSQSELKERMQKQRQETARRLQLKTQKLLQPNIGKINEKLEQNNMQILKPTPHIADHPIM